MNLRYLLFLAAALISSACSTEKTETTDLYQLVPSNTVWLAQINDWDKLENAAQNSRVYHHLAKLPSLRQIQDNWHELQAVLPVDSLQILKTIPNALLCESLSGAEKYDWLLIAHKGKADFNSIRSLLESQFKISSSDYSDQEILTLESKSKKLLYLHFKKDYFLISPNRIPIENSIRQINNPNIWSEDNNLKNLIQTRNSNAIANIFIRLELANDYLKALYKNEDFAYFRGLGDWIILDLEAEKQDLILTGLLNHPSEEFNYPEVFSELHSNQISAVQIVPQNLANWVHLNVGNIGQYSRSYNSYLETNGKLESQKALIKKLPAASTDKILGLIDNEMGVFSAGRSNAQAFHFAYFNFRNEELCKQSLESLADSNFIEGYRGHIIRKVEALNLLPRLFGRLFDRMHQPFYILYGDFVIFGEDQTALKVLLNDLLDDKRLYKSASFQSLSNQLPGKSHIQIVTGFPEWLPNQLMQLKKSAAAELEQKLDSLSEIKWGILQLRASEKKSFLSLQLREEKAIIEKISRQWTTQLEAKPSGEPQFLKNHLDQKYDIALRDDKNKLYLISRKGEVYWGKALDGPIIGEIHQIDIYRNNKLQMVFNTATTLYAVDRLGRDIEGFPIKLTEKASAPLGVFNYDGTRNYRLVVPCGKKLFNYNVEGNLVKGWDFKEADAPIISEPQHFSVSGADIIVCLSASGKLYQLNRRGEERFVLDQKIEELKTSFYLKEGPSLKESELLAGSNSGKMYVIHPQSKVDAIYLDESHPADHLIYFEGRYIFSNDEKLFVKDDKRPFSVSFDSNIKTKPKAMLQNSRFYVAAFAEGAEEIRLFNEEGNLVDGFPVFAQGPFDMGSLNRDNNLNIVTYSNDGTVICYRLQ
jgi:hypothetical protein